MTTNIAEQFIEEGNAGYTNDTTENAGQRYEMALKCLGNNGQVILRGVRKLG